MCKASPAIVYKFLTTPACLMRWFCDEVDIEGDTFTYVWAGEPEFARFTILPLEFEHFILNRFNQLGDF
ncbi:MAG: START-like domain-containing protein, partial [Bacteroidota bacterium]